jgi:hypothetical protein
MRKSHEVASGLLAAAAIVATLWSPAVSDELRPIQYKVTLLEQVRHEFAIEAHNERAARAVALLEARRTLGSSNPAWKPGPPTVLAHVHEGADFGLWADGRAFYDQAGEYFNPATGKPPFESKLCCKSPYSTMLADGRLAAANS